MSTVSESNPTSPQDLLHYAPRWMRERPDANRLSLVPEAQASDLQASELPVSPPPILTSRAKPRAGERVERAAPKVLDAQLEHAVFESLRHSLDPHVIHEPPDYLKDQERRSALFKIVGRSAAAIGVAAAAAFFVVNLLPVSRQPDAGSSLLKAVQSITASVSPATNTARPEPSETQEANAGSNKADSSKLPALAQFEHLLTPVTQTQAPQGKTADAALLQQFMRWNDKANPQDGAK